MRRNFQQRSHKPGNQNGPLMTSHIELRDLDLELELLKRKREMIEQQQQQYTNNHQFNSHQRQYNFNEHSQMFKGQQQHNSNQNFPQNYGQTPPPPFVGNHYGGGSSLGKRPSDQKWTPNSAPKRFSGPQGGPKKKFGAGPNQRPKPDINRPAPFTKQQQGPPRIQPFQPKPPAQQPQPWNNQLPFYMGSSSAPPSQRFNSTKAKPQSRDFKPTKVTKPKKPTSNLGNKLVSYPLIIHPNRMVPPKVAPKPAASKPAAPKPATPKSHVDVPLDAFILHADKVPSQQVAGRLELGLGSILKDIKQKYSDQEEYKTSFLSHIFMREVKQAIRERLRAVMIGKHVGKIGTIVEHYRNVFPLESDSEIVNVALEALKAANNKRIYLKLEDTDSPEAYFKQNADQLICKALDEMFKKLQEIYCGDPTELKKAFSELVEENPQDFSKDVDIQDIKKSNDNTEGEPNVVTEGNDLQGGNEKEGENKIKKSNDNTEGEPNVVTEGNDLQGGNEKEGENKEKDSNVSTEEANKEETKIESESGVQDANSTNESKEQSAVNDSKVNQRFKTMEVLVGNIIRRRLAYILPKFEEQISKLLNSNSRYEEAKKGILLKLQDKLSIESRIEAVKGCKTDGNKDTSIDSVKPTPAASTPAPTPRTPGRILPYYVKIVGRPSLPKRKLMQTFLQQYNPKSIKKHRNMHLLFVGFDNKEDFDKMVAVKETFIGKIRINIKVSEKTLNESQNESFNVSEIKDDNDDDVQVVDLNRSLSSDIINADLDGQINDLLSSIRKEEEQTETPSKESGDSVTDNENKEDTNNQTEAVAAAVNAESDDVMITESTEKVTEEGEQEKPANGVENGADCEIVDDNKTADVVLIDDKNEADVELIDDKNEADVENENREAAANDKNEMETESSVKTDSEEADKLEALRQEKETGRATPTRASARIANVTPSSIRTRRASRLAQN